MLGCSWKLEKLNDFSPQQQTGEIKMKIPAHLLALSLSTLKLEGGCGSMLLEIKEGIKEEAYRSESLFEVILPERTGDPEIDLPRVKVWKKAKDKAIEALRQHFATEPARLVDTTVQMVLEGWVKCCTRCLMEENTAYKEIMFLLPMNNLFKVLIEKGCPRDFLKSVPGSQEIFACCTIEEENPGDKGPYHMN